MDHRGRLACLHIISSIHFYFLRGLDFILLLRGRIVEAPAFSLAGPLAVFRGSNRISNCNRSKAAVRSRMILMPARSSPQTVRSASMRRRSANAIAVKVVPVITRGRRGEEKMMFAINQNRPPGHVHQMRRRFNCVNGIGWRVEQLDLTRSELGRSPWRASSYLIGSGSMRARPNVGARAQSTTARHLAQATLTSMCLDLARSFLGRCTVSNPFLNSAFTLLPSASSGRAKLRIKVP